MGTNNKTRTILVANPDTGQSCLGCSSYFGCKDELKSAAWICAKFNPFESTHVDDLLGQAQTAIDLNTSSQMEFGNDDPEEIGEFERMINQALASNRLVPLDLSIDDSGLPEAKNFYDWCYGSLGVKFRPFSRQLWIATMLFGEICPHCSNPDWLDINNVPVDYKSINMPEHLTFLDYGVCPSCNLGRADMFKAGDLNIFQELTVCLGQRAGKSSLAGVLCSYHVHKLLKTTRPSEFYGLDGATNLTHTYTGLQYKRAFALLWTPIKNTITDSPWYRSYFQLMKQHGEKIGEELIVIKDSFINFRRSRLLIGPAAPNIGTLRGDTRCGGAIDELGLFKFGAGAEDYVTISADEIHASLSNALATVRVAASKLIRSGENNVQQAIMFNLSSPMSVFDKIMTLVRASVGSRTMLGVRLPTWEVNPMVTREDLQVYWDTDPVKAERDFGANPPLAAAAFFEDQEKVAAMFTGTRNRVSYQTLIRTNKQGVLEKAARITNTQEMAKMPPSLMTMDSGVTSNSFSLSISIPVVSGVIRPQPRQSAQGFTQQRKGATPLADARLRVQEKVQRQLNSRPLDINSDNNGENLKCRVLATLEVIPPKGGRINFRAMYERAIVPLLKPFNVRVLVTDRWQNILLLDQARDHHNIDTFQYSLRYTDFEAIRSYMEGGRLECPATETRPFEDILTFDHKAYPYCFENRPIDHLALQFLTVQDTGRTVDKGPNLTDDSFRSVALAMHYLKNIDFVKSYLSGQSTMKSHGGGLVAMPGGDGGGGNQTSHTLTGNANRALVATGSGGSDAGNTFARTPKR